jgi:hypothetical protein
MMTFSFTNLTKSLCAKPLWAFLALFSAASSVAMAEDTAAPDLDPQAVEILAHAADYLAAQDSMSVDWFVSYDLIADGREKITKIRSGHNLMERDGGFYSYSENGMETREFFYDGQTFLAVDVEENAWAQVAFEGSFDSLVATASEQYDTALPIWQIMSRNSNNELLADAETAAYLGLTRIAGQEAHHLAFANYNNDWQVWVATDTENPLLLMIVGTDPYKQGWPQYRAYFTSWDFAPDIDEGAFIYVPDAESEQMVWPKSGRTMRGGDLK